MFRIITSALSTADLKIRLKKRYNNTLPVQV